MAWSVLVAILVMGAGDQPRCGPGKLLPDKVQDLATSIDFVQSDGSFRHESVVIGAQKSAAVKSEVPSVASCTVQGHTASRTIQATLAKLPINGPTSSSCCVRLLGTPRKLRRRGAPAVGVR